MFRRLVTSFLLLSSVSAHAVDNKVDAIQQAQINQLQKKAEKYPEIDLLKVWQANHLLGNLWNPSDGGSLEASFDNGVVTPTNVVGSHHILIGTVDLSPGKYRVDLLVVPATTEQAWIHSIANRNKTVSFYARVGSLRAVADGITTQDLAQTTQAAFNNGAPQTSPAIAPAVSVSSDISSFAAGRQEIWVGFNPYVGTKKLQVLSAVLRRVE